MREDVLLYWSEMAKRHLQNFSNWNLFTYLNSKLTSADMPQTHLQEPWLQPSCFAAMCGFVPRLSQRRHNVRLRIFPLRQPTLFCKNRCAPLTNKKWINKLLVRLASQQPLLHCTTWGPLSSVNSHDQPSHHPATILSKEHSSTLSIR